MGVTQQAPLEAGAREIRWAPRVALHAIRRLYETDALGIVDDEQIDEVGYALYVRCRSVIDPARTSVAGCAARSSVSDGGPAPPAERQGRNHRHHRRRRDTGSADQEWARRDRFGRRGDAS